jgi:hypothetical protein
MRKTIFSIDIIFILNEDVAAKFATPDPVLPENGFETGFGRMQ